MDRDLNRDVQRSADCFCKRFRGVNQMMDEIDQILTDSETSGRNPLDNPYQYEIIDRFRSRLDIRAQEGKLSAKASLRWKALKCRLNRYIYSRD